MRHKKIISETIDITNINDIEYLYNLTPLFYSDEIIEGSKLRYQEDCPLDLEQERHNLDSGSVD